LLYYFWKAFFYLVLILFCGLKVRQAHRLPGHGPVIVVSNHVSYWDPIVVGVALGRKVHFMAKAELFTVPVVGGVVRQMEAFPVNRGLNDRAAIKTALKYLKAGRVVGIFPEGTRSKDGRLQEFQAGAASLALRTDAAILPVAVLKTKNPFAGWWFNPVEVRVGMALHPTEMGLEAQDINNLVRLKVKELLEAS